MKRANSTAVRPVRRRGGRARLVACSVLLLTALTVALVFVVLPGSRAAASFLHAQPGSLPWNERTPFTALLIGADRNEAAHEFMVVRFDPLRSTFTTLAVPTDLWVTIPGFGQGRIAEATANGGARLAVLTTESVLGMPIPYYAEVGSGAFTALVDAFGGVTVTVNHPVHLDMSHGSTGPTVALGAGVSHLDGQTTTAYLAGSHSTGATERMARESHVALALRDTALQPAQMFRIPGLVSTLGGLVTTNIPYNQMVDLARGMGSVTQRHCLSEMLSYNNGAFTDYTVSGSRVLLPSWQQIHTLVGAVFGRSSVPAWAGVAVLNGSGVPGQANGLAAWLRGVHIPISSTGSARSFSVAHTHVAISSAAGPADRAVAADLAALLQVPTVKGPPKGTMSRVTIVLGQDFQPLDQQ